uniref:Uncharacterized protein n=1 Tax=Nelumbo nucifera TaxID=4432 RepID=A0A822ZB14_NELNU|nr:TPA_asm: hypothetical protein HUJ06_000542 [Nelumbo nucifera]
MKRNSKILEKAKLFKEELEEESANSDLTIDGDATSSSASINAGRLGFEPKVFKGRIRRRCRGRPRTRPVIGFNCDVVTEPKGSDTDPMACEAGKRGRGMPRKRPIVGPDPGSILQTSSPQDREPHGCNPFAVKERGRPVVLHECKRPSSRTCTGVGEDIVHTSLSDETMEFVLPPCPKRKRSSRTCRGVGTDMVHTFLSDEKFGSSPFHLSISGSEIPGPIPDWNDVYIDTNVLMNFFDDIPNE